MDAYRLAQQGVTGDVVAGRDKGVGAADKAVTAGGESPYEVLLYALGEIERLALELGRRESEVEGLCREVARLEAERGERCRGGEASRGQGGQAGQHNGQGGQRGGLLARLGPWLWR